MEALCSFSLSLFSTVLSLPNNEWSWRIHRNLSVCYSDKRMHIVGVCVCVVCALTEAIMVLHVLRGMFRGQGRCESGEHTSLAPRNMPGFCQK
jgi:hypothetical protein